MRDDHDMAGRLALGQEHAQPYLPCFSPLCGGVRSGPARRHPGDVRVLRDEQRLESRFGDSYRAYKACVKRWIPGVL
jgi:hypothetical protein